MESIHKKIISNETEYDSVEDALSVHRTASNETILVSEVPYITNDEYVIIAPGQGKKTCFNFKWLILWRTSISLSPS